MRITPLQPRDFFDGVWTGEGELHYVGILGRIRPLQRFRYTVTGRWVSETRKEFEDRFEFESGLVLQPRFTAEIVDAVRLQISSDDMPGGADIILSESSYVYTPYVTLVRIGPLKFRVRCRDENVIDEQGVIHDRIEMSWLGVPLATMTMTIHVDRNGSR